MGVQWYVQGAGHQAARGTSAHVPEPSWGPGCTTCVVKRGEGPSALGVSPLGSFHNNVAVFHKFFIIN